MQAIAIWCECDEGHDSEYVKADLHLNYWTLGKGNRSTDFLDIGIKVETIRNIKKIYLHLPFVKEKSRFIDLGGKIGKTGDLPRAIFNRDWNASRVQDSSKWYKVSNSDNSSTEFYIYALDPLIDEIQPEPSVGPSVYSITVNHDDLHDIYESENNDNIHAYYRLRYIVCGNGKIKNTLRLTGSYFEKIVNSVDVIDLRINEKRNLNDSLVSKMRKSNQINFNRIDFLIICPAKDDLLFSNRKIDSSRGLEQDLWELYIEKDCKIGEAIAYHWEKKRDNEKSLLSYTFYVKMKVEKLKWGWLIITLIMTSLFAVAAGYASTELYNTFPGLIASLF